MLMKRLYDQNARGKKRISGVRLVHSGTSPEQKWTTKKVDMLESLGLMSVGPGRLTLHAEHGDVNYEVSKQPGRWCCHCGQKLIDDADGAAARAHVKAEHDGKKSPDKENPSGYRMSHSYETVIDAKDHKQFSLKPRAVAAAKRG